MAVGQLFATNSIGGFLSAKNLSKELRMGVKAMAKFRQFADVRDAWGKVTRSGQTFTWDVWPMLSRASRALAETATIPAGQSTILQATLTMSERGFSIPYTEKLESLAEMSVRAPIMEVLRNDAQQDIDCVVHAEFNKTPLRYVSTSSADTGVAASLTTNSTATLTNTTLLSKINVRAIVDVMKGRNIPFYRDGHYVAIARPEALRLLKSDLESIHQYTETGLEMIFNGEVGRYWESRYVEQTTVPAGGAANDVLFDPFTNTAEAWGTAGSGDWVFFFGADTVCEAVHTPEEIRAKMPDDFGRSRGIAWYALLGYGITHTDATQARIVKFDSAV